MTIKIDDQLYTKRELLDHKSWGLYGNESDSERKKIIMKNMLSCIVKIEERDGIK